MKYLWGWLKVNLFDCLVKTLQNKLNQKEIILHACDLIEYVLINFVYHVSSFFKPYMPSGKVYNHLIELPNSLLQTNCFILIDHFIVKTKTQAAIGRHIRCNEIMNVGLDKCHICLRAILKSWLWQYLSMNILLS